MLRILPIVERDDARRVLRARGRRCTAATTRAAAFASAVWLTMRPRDRAPVRRAAGAARRVTVLGVLCQRRRVWPAALGGRWLLLAAVVVVALGAGRQPRRRRRRDDGRHDAWGYVLDSVVDRVGDCSTSSRCRWSAHRLGVRRRRWR